MLKAIVLVDLNEFPSIFQKVPHSHSRQQKTTSNLLRINLRGILKFNEIWPQEGALYITLWQKFGGHPKNFSFMQFCQKIDGFRQRFTGLLELLQLYKQNPLEKFLIFTIYQNYTLAFMNMPKLMPWVVVYNIHLCLSVWCNHLITEPKCSVVMNMAS